MNQILEFLQKMNKKDNLKLFQLKILDWKNFLRKENWSMLRNHEIGAFSENNFSFHFNKILKNAVMIFIKAEHFSCYLQYKFFTVQK